MKQLHVLEYGTLRFTRVDKLEDQFEGRLTIRERQQLLEMGKEPAAPYLETWESSRQESFVNCWCEQQQESMAMWDLYGKGGDSVAIKSSVGRIEKAIAGSERPLYLGRVKYLDWTEYQAFPNNVLGMFVRKIQSYQHEREVRLMAWAPDFREFFVPDGNSGRDLNGPVCVSEIECMVVKTLEQIPALSEVSTIDQLQEAARLGIDRWLAEARLKRIPAELSVSIDAAEMVDEIVVGPRVPTWVTELASRVLLRYGVFRVRHSDLRQSILPT